MHELSASPNRSAERVLTLGAVFLIWAFLISVRLFDLQVLTHARYLHMADAQQYRVLPILPRRGAILDRDRNYLAISSRSRVLAVNPGQIDSKALAAQLLGRILQ